MDNKGLKRTIIIGASLGALFSLGVALSMDYFLSSSLQGSWREAAVKDVTKLFGASCGQNWFAVTFVLVVVMGFLALFGAVLGAVAGTIMHRFFRVILK